MSPVFYTLLPGQGQCGQKPGAFGLVSRVLELLMVRSGSDRPGPISLSTARSPDAVTPPFA